MHFVKHTFITVINCSNINSDGILREVKSVGTFVRPKKAHLIYEKVNFQQKVFTSVLMMNLLASQIFTYCDSYSEVMCP